MQQYNKVIDMNRTEIAGRLAEIHQKGHIVECVFKKANRRESYLLIDIDCVKDWFIVSSGLAKKFKKILFSDVREIKHNYDLWGSNLQAKLSEFKLLYEQKKN
jgi:hypothetical protein